MAYNCRKHRNKVAGWRCRECKKYLCEECAAEYFNVSYCALCDGFADPMTTPRADRSLFVWTLDALAYPLRAILAVVLVAGMMVGADVMAEAFQPSGAAAASAPKTEAQKNIEEAKNFLKQDSPELGIAEEEAARAAAQAQKPKEMLPLHRVALQFKLLVVALFVLIAAGITAWRPRSQPWGQRAFQMLKSLIASVVIAGPAVVYFWFIWRHPAAPPLAKDHVTLAFIGLVLLYWPAALAASTVENGFAWAINPLKVFDGAWRVGLQYWISVVLIAGMVAAGYYSRGVVFNFGPGMDILESLVREIILVACIAVAARTIGLLTYVRGDVFGWGTALQYRDLMFPDMKAQGVCEKHRPNHHLKDHMSSVLGKDDEFADDEEVKELRDLLINGKTVRALDLYEDRDDWPDGVISDRDYVALGAAAERKEKFQLAADLYENAVSLGGVRECAALLALMQLQKSKLGRPDDAYESYENLVKKFPKSHEAKKATRLIR